MKKYLWIMSLTFPLCLAACAHSQIEKDLDQKLQSSSAIPGKEDLSVEAQNTIATNSTLTPDQRARLLDLQKRTHEQITNLRDLSFKLRDLLISDVAGPNYKEDEVNAIKARLNRIEKLRLTTIFDAIDEANKILGRNTPNRYAILRDIGPRGR